MENTRFLIETENQSQIFMGITDGYLYHAHLRFEILFMFSGEIEVTVKNEQHKLHRGDMLIVNPFEQHSYKLNDASSIGFFIMFPDNFSPQITSILSNKIFDKNIVSDSELFDSLLPLIQHIIEHYKMHDYLMMQSDPYISGMLTVIVAILSEKIKMRSFSEKSGELMFTVLKYLHSHFTEQINARSIAEKFGYSERHFAKIFHEFSQKSLPDYITEIRLNNAITLITDGESLIDAAQQSGFNSLATFHRVFKQKYGIPPKQYINQTVGKSLKLKIKRSPDGKLIL